MRVPVNQDEQDAQDDLIELDRAVAEFESRLSEQAANYLRARCFSAHPLLDNDEIDIVIASAFKAGARWGGHSPCV